MLISIGRRSQPEGLVALLLECHQRIRNFVRIAEEVGRRDDLSVPDVVDACQRCERYFTEALPLHVEDEEKSLLPRLRGIREDVDRALAAMSNQHTEHEALIRDLLAAMRDVRGTPNDARARERLRAVASRLSVEFEQHLSNEEQVIFPAARMLAEDEQKRAIAELRARRGSRAPAS